MSESMNSLRLPISIEEFLREVGSDLVDEVKTLSPEALGQQMNIVSGPPEAMFPKNSGLLFFNDERLSYLVRLLVHPQATVETGQVTGQVDSWVISVLRACAVKPLKSREIQELVNISHRETFQRNYLDHLLEREWLERTIPDKPTSSSQKYRLTEKGRSMMGQQ